MSEVVKRRVPYEHRVGSLSYSNIIPSEFLFPGFDPYIMIKHLFSYIIYLTNW